MKIKVKRFDKSLPLPQYKTPGAACFDCYCREDTTVQPKSIGYIPLNIALEVPKDTWGTFGGKKFYPQTWVDTSKWVLGIGDWDFRGDTDEYKFIVYNIKYTPVTIEKGTRIAQMMVVKYERVHNLKKLKPWKTQIEVV